MRDRHNLDIGEPQSPIHHIHLFTSLSNERALGLRYQTRNHGGKSLFLNHAELAALLTPEDIEKVKKEQEKFGEEEESNCCCCCCSR